MIALPHLTRWMGLTCLTALMTGCVREISFGGVYIPAWMLCSLIGLVIGGFVSVKLEPRLAPEPGYFQMLVRLAFIVVVFILSYIILFVLL